MAVLVCLRQESTVAEKDIAAAVARSAAAMIARRGRHGGRAIKVRFN